MTTSVSARWTKAVNGAFTTAADWTPNGVPTYNGADEFDVYIGGVYTSGTAAFTVTSAASEQVGFLEVAGANATLAVTGGEFLVESHVTPYSVAYNYGTISVAAGAVLAFGAAGGPSSDYSQLYNLHDVSVAGALWLADPAFGLYGQGILTLSGKILGANTGSVTNFFNKSTIQGSGQIGSGATLDLFNYYGDLINANASAALTINTGANTIYNEGTIETTGAGGLVIESNMQLDGALIAAGAGALTLLNEETVGGGRVSVGARSTIKLDNGQISIGGVMSIAAGGVVETVAGNTAGVSSNNDYAGDVLTPGDIEDAGSIVIVNDSTLNMNASTYNSGVLDINGSTHATKLEVFGNGLSLDNAKGVVMSNSALNSIVSNGSGESLSLETGLSGAGVIGDLWLRLENLLGSTINANGAVSLTILADTSAVANGSESENYNNGTIENTGRGGLVLSGGTVGGGFNSAGYLKEDGAGALTLKNLAINSGGGIVDDLLGTIVLDRNSQISHQERLSIAAGALLTTTAGDTDDSIYTSVFNHGAIDAVAGSTLAVDSHWTNSATLNIGSATAGAVVEIAAGNKWELLGAGRVNMSDANDRIVSAGAGAVFEDKSNLIVGGGVIGDVNMSVNIENGATVDATLATGLTLNATAQDDATGQTYLYNAGILEATGAGGLTLNAAAYSPGQLIAENGSKIVANDAVYGNGRTTINGASSVEFHAEADNDTYFGAQTGGDLILNSSSQFYGDIWGFAGGDSIDLRDFAFVAGKTKEDPNTSGFNPLGGTLFVTNGTTDSSPLYLYGNYTAAYLSAHDLAFEFVSDGHLISGTSSDGTLVKLVSTS